MSDLARQEAALPPTQMVPTVLDPMTVARIFRQSGMFPDIQSEAAAAAKLIIGRGLGLSDYDAMSGLHIIKGKAVLAANLMAAAIKRAGKYDYRVVVSDDTVCTIDFFGGGEKIGSSSFSVEDAKRAGLSGDNWRKYTRAMLFARCISAGYKTHCPDALGAAPVYVEAHGEMEITEDAPPPRAVSPAQMRSMTPEERKEDTRRLLSSGREEAAPKAAPAANADVFVIPPTARIAAVKTTNGNTVWRLDLDGRDEPIAVRDPAIMSGIEANIAFSEPTHCRLAYDAVSKREVVVELVRGGAA
jgi:hypothetical protein